MYGLIDDNILTTDIVIPKRPDGDPEEYSDEVRYKELYKCEHSPYYFIDNYVKILDDRTRDWVDFKLYPAQVNILKILQERQYVIILKTRQLGATTLVGGGYFLWLLLFSRNAHNLVLSKSEREAQVLMGDRFKPMFRKLPSWMKPAEDKSLPDSKTEFGLSNNGKMFSLPTSAGDSYTARACLVDEAALVHQSRTTLSDVLLAVQPTVAAGGQLILLSKADKSRPDSTFNSIFKTAIKGDGKFFPIFASWKAVPWRDQEWYDEQIDISKSIDGTKDFVTENYPETWEEALAPKELDRRLSPTHISNCFSVMQPLSDEEIPYSSPPTISGLSIYVPPEPGRRYIITADAAEGNPKSDPSCADVWDWETGEQVANIAGRLEPTVFGLYIDQVGVYYNNAPVFPERNNHGHSLIAWLQEHSDLRVLAGPDSRGRTKKWGYNTNRVAKASGYVELARMLKEDEILFHKEETKRQLSSIEGDSLRAPKKDNDDHAITAMLFAAARKYVHLEFLLGFA